MRQLIAFVAMCLTGSVAAAQSAPNRAPLQLSVDEAIQRGIDTSHRLAESLARADAANAAADQRRASQLPQLSALAGYTRTNHVDEFAILMPNRQLQVVYPDLPNNYRSRLDVQWPIYTAGRLDAIERAARAEASATRDDVEAARADLRLEIRRAYLALATATESVRVVDESVTRVDAHLRDVRNEFTAGLVPPNDVSSVEAQESRQRMLRIQAVTQRDIAEAELGRLVGVAPGTAIVVNPPAAVAEAEPAAVSALIEEAKQARRERAALVARVTAASERAVAATAGGRPAIALGGGVDYANPNPRFFPRQGNWRESWDASVNVNWPIFDGGRVRAERAEADATVRAARERLADFDAGLAVEIQQRSSEIASSRAAIDAASDAVRSAAESRRVVGDRFAAGVATSTDVLDAQVALLQAELDRTQAVANATFAGARLARALGR